MTDTIRPKITVLDSFQLVLSKEGLTRYVLVRDKESKLWIVKGIYNRESGRFDNKRKWTIQDRREYTRLKRQTKSVRIHPKLVERTKSPAILDVILSKKINQDNSTVRQIPPSNWRVNKFNRIEATPNVSQLEILGVFSSIFGGFVLNEAITHFDVSRPNSTETKEIVARAEEKAKEELEDQQAEEEIRQLVAEKERKIKESKELAQKIFTKERKRFMSSFEAVELRRELKKFSHSNKWLTVSQLELFSDLAYSLYRNWQNKAIEYLDKIVESGIDEDRANGLIAEINIPVMVEKREKKTMVLDDSDFADLLK